MPTVPGTPDNAITIPPRPPWFIDRPAPAARLEKGTAGPVTVVTGPPGAGKTALVAAWAAARPPAAAGRLAWASCDAGMGRDAFWTLVLAALVRAGAAGAEFVPPAARPGGADDAFLADLAIELSGGAGTEPVVLVLDDFHSPLSPAVVHGLAFLSERARPRLRLVLVGRHDPPLSLHRLRLAGELTEIRNDALAFGPAETGALLAQHGVELPAASAAALRRRTDGWAAGLRLAAMSMEHDPDPEAFVARFAGDDQSVVGYLVEQVLDAQPRDVRRVLLRTSVGDRLTADLAMELAGAAGAGVFPALVRQNAFVLPLGGGWYRYQRMFAEALRVVLRHELPGEVAGLHRRASRWFAREGFLPEAVGHSIRAGDWAHACRLVVDRRAVGEVLGLTGDRALARAFAAMPAAVAAEVPEAAVVAAASALARG
ncbi:AAA family ATPase, partial [Spirillospora sp. NPDC029432]|uniref:AAA family ATPase n=1 Tax=Spirillospora sp. NPDC029432 TaxID=3154599 RepID=UPI003453C8F5